jgi:hypothetical protein
LNDVAKVVMPDIAEKMRPAIASQLIDVFENHDCDTIDEVEQEDIRAEYNRRNPLPSLLGEPIEG